MFKVETHNDADAIVLTVTGDVDVTAVDELCQRGLNVIALADDAAVVLDAAGVSFIDSSGLGALVTLNNAATAVGTPFLLRAVPPRMASLLRLTAIDTVIPVSGRCRPLADRFYDD
jgi:anti-sigma B factor antagonist